MNQQNNLVIAGFDHREWSKKLFDNLDISEATSAEYGLKIRYFTEFIQSSGFNKNSYLDYKRFLAERSNLSVSTKNKYLIVARIYCNELHRQAYLPIDITLNIKSFKQGRKHKKDGFSETEIQQILGYLQSKEENCDTNRKKALLSLMILQGLRQVEIVRLNVTDIDLVTKTALVQGKGSDDKDVVDLHPVTVEALRCYIKKSKIADGALFTSTSNRSKNQRLTTKSIRNIINPILKELDIDKTVHGFRHYFTTTLINAYKGDLLTVAQYTRHKSLEMLQVYNDTIKHKADLPQYYQTFQSINFDQNEAPISHNYNYQK